MHTLTPRQLADLVCRSAAGYYPSEAAARLLVDHDRWLHRHDFTATCVEYDHDGSAPIAWVDWQAIPAFVEHAACSSSEARILRLAAELAGVDTGTPLADLLSGLDATNIRLVLHAIGHVLTQGGRR